MRKFAWAALLSLPFVAFGADRASAGGCLNLQGGFRIKICGAGYLKACCEPFSLCNPCCGSGYGGYNGGGGFNECCGVVPGPWYTYWPYGGAPAMTSQVAYPGWTYDSNFQTPAPVAYPFWPAAASTAPSTGAYPSYWAAH